MRYAFPAFAAVMLLLPALPVPEFWITQSIYIGLYSLVALGLVLLTGVAGLTSFGQAAFVGIGAYTAAYLATTSGISPWLTLRWKCANSQPETAASMAAMTNTVSL